MKKIILGFGLGIAVLNSFAQTKESTAYSFSLKQAIDFAMQNQSSVKNATLSEEIAKVKVQEVTALGLPQITGSVQFAHNDPLRRMFGVGDGKYNFMAQDIVPEGKVFAAPNLFQLASGGDAGISISQLIFSSSYFVGLKASKTYKELATKSTEQTKIQVIENVTKAYYMVLINEERIKLFEKNVARVDSMLRQTTVMYQNGLVEKIDLDRIQVTYNNIMTEKEKFNNLFVLSQTLLKYQISMPLDNELTLTDKIADVKIDNIGDLTSQKVSYTNRIEYSLLESQKKLQLLDLKNNKYAVLPTIAAFGNIGVFSQSPEFNYLSKSNLWYNYGMFGINMSVPIFTGLGQLRKVQQSKLNLQIIENNISSFEETIQLQIKSAQTSLKNSATTLALQNQNLELAKEIARITKIKYQQGVGSSLEVTTAETSFLEAQTNYYNALFDAIVAKLDFDKANGTLVH